MTIATGASRSSLPALIYSMPFVMSQNCKMQGYGVKWIKVSVFLFVYDNQWCSGTAYRCLIIGPNERQ